MPIRADQLKEKEDFQKLILERLEEDNKFRIRPNTAYKPGLAMDTEVLLEFLEDTQHDEMERLRRMYKDRTNDTVINYINSEINKESRGLIDVIKHGVEFDNGVTLRLMYRKPDSTINTQAVANYQKNIFSVMEEVYHKADERIDLVIFLNGLAIFAVELKCNTSGQSYEDAIKQYKNERDPATRLFKSRVGVFAAFAMDLNEVYFTTELKGPDTFFNPFNIGENFGKGNPHNQNGVNVSYMWENIWTKDKILFLIERFIYIKKKERKDADTGKIKKSKELIFPRFHQLRAVERVMNDVIENHTSCNYLIEHSAGSGKTETISWLAHILATVHDVANENIFDTVLIITDRIIVDRQLQEAILGIEHKSGQVKVMDDRCDSEDLAIALGGNTKIVVTTIHKFYYILNNNLLGNLKDKKFAVLIDEAHSSTEGVYMQSVTNVLSNEDDEEEKTEEDSLMELVRHTIEFIKRKPYGNKLLIKVKDEVKLVIDATPGYEPYDRQKIIEQNKKNTVRHAYFREYLALQRLCLLILRHQKHQIGLGSRQIYGILFDGAWLWEEYINSLIENVFYHPMNKGGKGAQRLFEGNVGLIYPDFISRNSELRMIADAKYKPISNIGNRDYLQVLAYMFRFDAKTGYYLYPEAGDSEDKKLRMNRGSTYEANVSPRDDICITKHGLKIPMDATDYAGFVIKMKISEQEFMSAFC